MQELPLDDIIRNYGPNVATSLKEWIENRANCHNPDDEVFRNFLIQFTVFVKGDVEKQYSHELDKEIEVEDWYAGCTIPETYEEGIYCTDEDSLSYSGEMKVQISSYKCNYDSFIFDDEEYSYACNYYKSYASIKAMDLYPGFEEKSYKGGIYTRGGFTGWNHIDVPVYEMGG
jgi:hypothetical protein